ncbi:MAG: PulJ/GspJ family protein [Oscillospiraceae bacterium]
MKHRKKGFTLVETVTATALAVVVIALTGSVLVAIFGLFGSHATTGYAKATGDTVYQWVQKQMIYCTSLQITNDTSIDAYNTCLQVQDGHLKIWNTEQGGSNTPADLFGNAFYNGMSVRMDTQVVNGRWLNLAIRVYDAKGDEKYHTASTIELVNMSLALKNTEEGQTPDPDATSIGGALSNGEAYENPVLCFSSDIRVQKEDYSVVPATLYWQQRSTWEWVQENKTTMTKETSMDLFGVLPHQITNDQIRKYVRTYFYPDQRWPLFPQELLKLYSFSNPASPNQTLDQAPELEMQTHVDSATGSVIVYAIPRKNTDPQNNYYASPTLIFVPDDPKTFAGGMWYTAMPTISGTTRSTYQVSVTSKRLNEETYYQDIRSNWNPLR